VSLLEVTDLRTYFDTPRGFARAVDGVSLSVERGETVGIVGESGSGKSVLMRSVMRLLPPAGVVQPGSRVHFDGRDMLALGRKELRGIWGSEMAIIFQDPMTALNPVKRVDVQLTEALRVRDGLSRAEANARAAELLDQVGISDPARRLRQYPHELSGGMRQRVTIARALAGNPSLLIADEPTTALDVTVQAQILDLLADLQSERQMAMVLITHDLGVVADQANRIAVMYAGRIVEWTTGRDLFTGVRHPYTKGLLESVPRIEDPSQTRLAAIPGQPPSLTNPIVGCPFAPRCPNAQPLCLEERPPLTFDDPTHAHACHFPLSTTVSISESPRRSDALLGGDPT
jgi:peptide/nickel transport system ATP-binding protein